MYIQLLIKYLPYLIIAGVIFTFGYYLADVKGDKIALGLKNDIAELTRMHAVDVNTVRTENQKTIIDLNERLKNAEIEYSTKLNEETDAIQKDANATINDLRTDTIRLRDKYASQPTSCPTVSERPETDSNPTAPVVSDRTEQTGILSRETSEFLVRLAEDADLTNAALKQCIGQYDTVRNELNNTEISNDY